MIIASDSSTASPAEKTETTGPEWENIPFDVDCARCGHDLRGLTEPVCPACKLEFDWSDAAPIEQLTCLHCDYHLYGLQNTRCPECGEGFTWSEVLTDYRARKKPLFEYRWRPQPVRSLVTTLRAGLRPRRLWRQMDMHDPPAVGPLLAQCACCLMIAVPVHVVGTGLAVWCGMVSSFGWRSTRYWDPRAMFLNCLKWTALDPTFYLVFVPILVWLATSFAALMIFRQSMRLYKVRTVHVVRAWAYAVPLMLPLAAAVAPIMLIVTIVFGAFRPIDVTEWFYLLSLPYVVWSVACAYGIYLRMRHGFAVALCSQVIAVLSAVAICDQLLIPGYAGSLVYGIGKAFRLYNPFWG